MVIEKYLIYLTKACIQDLMSKLPIRHTSKESKLLEIMIKIMTDGKEVGQGVPVQL